MHNDKSFIISKENWSLHRKGYRDQQRHLEKVKEALEKNLPDLITEESIILSRGRDVIKVPIRSLNEYKIRYSQEKTDHVGHGHGDTKVGDIIARERASYQKGDKGHAGDEPGTDYYEAEVSLAEIEERLFKELELPNLDPKHRGQVVTEEIIFNDIRKKGLMGNIDKKRTILNAIKRKLLQGKQTVGDQIIHDDLRYKTWNEETQPESNAVIIAMMDTSGSMGHFEKYLARSFFFWMTKFLRKKYDSVAIEFIAHHTEAKIVSEEEFFSRGESGGTICSSVYTKALEVIQEKYYPTDYNVYPFHFSDGDNMASDNKKCVNLVQQLMELSNMFGYGEVNTYNRRSTLMRAFQNIEDPKFRFFILKEKKDVYYALKHFFQK